MNKPNNNNNNKDRRIVTPVNLIIFQNDKILLLKRAEKEDQFYGYWSIPGGGPKLEEDFETALEREILEETNCKIKEKRYFKSYYYKLNENLHVRSIYFFGTIQGNIKISDESLDFRWFDFKEILDKNFNLAYNQKDVLLEFQKFIKYSNVYTINI